MYGSRNSCGEDTIIIFYIVTKCQILAGDAGPVTGGGGHRVSMIG